MGRRYQRFSWAELEALWASWRAGETTDEIAAALAAPVGSVYSVVRRHGGIPPRPRRRAPQALRFAEREEISRGLASGTSLRAIARTLRRAPSTISREIDRHGGPQQYRATAAEARAWQSGARPKRCRLACARRLRRVVAAKLRRDWSPEQIARWLVTTYPDDPTMHVSHETIYRTLYVQARGALKQELVAHLRRHGVVRHSRARTARPEHRGQIPGAISITERPPAVEDRAVPGHWEGDLLAGTKRSQIGTLVERRSRYVLLVRLPGKDAETVARALIRRVRQLPTGLMQSLTWDRGLEMAGHVQFTVATEVPVYFCDPRSPWQRGSNENTNGLLRQYFPKGMDVSTITQRQLDAIALRLNTRPRKTLNWKTPAQALAATVALTG
jgi:IS30 family transposase